MYIDTYYLIATASHKEYLELVDVGETSALTNKESPRWQKARPCGYWGGTGEPLLLLRGFTATWRIGKAALRRLDQIEVPTMIAWPHPDRVMSSMERGARFAQEIRGTVIRHLTGVGHIPMWDDPTLITDTIVDWAAGERVLP
jgi:pimeloyl-ACP methyl ester carboxylesterase